MNASYTISEILKVNSIIDYLADRNLEPYATGNGRVTYYCPLHNEDTPSFVVYLCTPEVPYEKFHCFGCNRWGNVIHLKSQIESISLGKAISLLVKGLNINLDDELEFIIKELTQQQVVLAEYSLDQLSLSISRTMYVFMKNVDFEEPYFSRAEKVLQLLDEAVSRADIQQVRDMNECLGEFVPQQVAAYTDAQEQERLDVAITYAEIEKITFGR